jgi:hypothetical protein
MSQALRNRLIWYIDIFIYVDVIYPTVYFLKMWQIPLKPLTHKYKLHLNARSKQDKYTKPLSNGRFARFLLLRYINERRSLGCECNGRMSLRTWKISDSNLGQYIGYPEIFLNPSTWLRLFVFGATAPHWARASSVTKFLDHTQRCAAISRAPLDEWSARRRDLYLTTHNTHNRQISMLLVGFETKTSAEERPQTYALDRAATGAGNEVSTAPDWTTAASVRILSNGRRMYCHIKTVVVWAVGNVATEMESHSGDQVFWIFSSFHTLVLLITCLLCPSTQLNL